MSKFDKYKSCKGCPDRVAACHDECDGYQFRCREREEIRKKEKARKIIPTAHHVQVVTDFYKRQKKYRNLR